MDKEYILNHVSDLDAEQLAQAILSGVVTMEELKATDELDVSKRRAITRLLQAGQQQADDAWNLVDQNNEAQVRAFIENNPGNPHITEAQSALDTISRRRENDLYEHSRILNSIRLNPNTYTPADIQNFLSRGILTRSELVQQCEIPDSAIDNIPNIRQVNLSLGEPPESIPAGYTEVYFWGGPGSGKTCALGAVLQMADYNGYLRIATGPGYNYATQLKNIFSHDNQANDYLPAPSPVDTTQYLPFTLQKPGERRIRSVSLIELSGEIFECFHWKNGNMPFPTRSHEETFNSLNMFLSSRNKKLHFFFIDAGRENRPDRFGLTQGDYLQAAATYFTNNRLFDKTTDAIYVVLTKSDLLVDENGRHVTRENRDTYAVDYLRTQRYSSFINVLKNICDKYSINGKKLSVVPFTLGKVYFQQICDFDGETASKIVEILLNRIPGERDSILDIFNA